jgi:hypothetical protein
MVKNSVLRTEYGGSFSPSNYSSTPVYTAPGSAPSGDLNPLSPLAGFAGAAVSVPGLLLDAALASIRGAADVTDLGTFSSTVGPEATRANTPSFAQAVDQALPQRLTPALENILLGGNREAIAKQVGEVPFLMGEIGGGLTLPFTLPSKAFKTFDVATDIASAFPGSAVMGGATTPLGAIGRGVATGLGSSALPAVDIAYDPNTKQFDLGAFGLTMGAGGFLGGAIPGGFAAPVIIKEAKNALDGLVTQASGMIKQSDNMQVIKQMRERQMQQMQMKAVSEALQQEQAKMIPRPEDIPSQYRIVPEEPIVDRTFAKTIQSYPEVLPASTDDFVETETLFTQLGNEAKQEYQALLDEYKSLPMPGASAKAVKYTEPEIEASGDIVDNAIAQFFGDKPAGLVSKDSFARIAKATDDKVLSSTYFRKKPDFNQLKKSPDKINLYLGGSVEDDIPLQIAEFLPDGMKDNPEVLSTLPERIVNFMEQNPTGVKSYKKKREENFIQLQKEQDGIANQKIETRRAEIKERAKELSKTIKDSEEVLTSVNQERQKRLPAVIPKTEEVVIPEQPARFIASNEGVEDAVNPWKATQQRILQDASPEIKAKVEAETVKPISKVTAQDVYIPQDETRRATWFTPIKNKISRISKSLGGEIQRYSTNARILPEEIKRALKPLKDAWRPYLNNYEIRAAVAQGNLDAVPPELKQAIEAAQETFGDNYSFLQSTGYEMPEKIKNYFPLRVKDLEKHKAITGASVDDLLVKAAHEAGITGENVSKLNKQERLNLVNKKLEKERTIEEYTPELMEAYHDPIKSLDMYAQEIGEARAKAELFGGNINEEFFRKLMPKLIEKHNIKAEDIPMITDSLAAVFGNKNFKASPVYKIYQNAMSLMLLTGIKTSAAQFSSVFSNLERTGLTNTIEGIYGTLKSLGALDQSFANRLGASHAIQDLSDIGQIRSFAELLDLVKSSDSTMLEKTGGVLNKASFALLNASDFAEKEMTMQSAYAWLKSNVGNKKFDQFISKYKTAFKPDEIKKLKADLKALRKDSKHGISLEVLRAIDAFGGERLVLDNLDKTGVALNETEAVRALQTLQTYAYKAAADINERTIMKASDAMRTGDIGALKDSLLNAVGAAGTIAGTAWLGLLSAGQDSDLKAIEEAFPEQAISMTAPALNRVLRFGSGVLRNPAPASQGMEVINAAYPGSTTVAKGLGEAGRLIATGDLLGIIDPEKNREFKNLPPRFLTQAIYEKSKRYADIQDTKRLQNSPTMARARQVAQFKDLAKVGLLTPENVDKLGSPELSKKITEAKTEQKYGTNDKSVINRAKLFKLAYPNELQAFNSIQERRYREGSISKEHYDRLMKDRNQIIMNVMEQKYLRGEL